MAAQAPVQTRTRDLRVQEFSDHRQQIIDRDRQRPAQNHRYGLLCRGQRGLQLVRRVAAVMNALSMPPFVDGLLSRPEPFRQDRRGLVVGLDRSPKLRRRRRLLVKMDSIAAPRSECPSEPILP